MSLFFLYIENIHEVLLNFLGFVKLVDGLSSDFPNPWTAAVKKELTILTSSILEKLRTNMLTWTSVAESENEQNIQS